MPDRHIISDCGSCLQRAKIITLAFVVVSLADRFVERSCCGEQERLQLADSHLRCFSCNLDPLPISSLAGGCGALFSLFGGPSRHIGRPGVRSRRPVDRSWGRPGGVCGAAARRLRFGHNRIYFSKNQLQLET